MTIKTNIKQKAVSGMFHSFLGLAGTNGIAFVVGMILARLLEPSDYGLLGMVAIFIAVSGVFVDSGLTTALIRETHVSNEEYSTVFYYNLGVSVIVYVILFLASEMVSSFYNQPMLVSIIRVLALTIVIGAFGNIQRTQMTRELNFKTQVKVDVVAAIMSSVVGVYLAYDGKGVWALVFMNLTRVTITSLLLIVSNRWLPLLIFEAKAFKRFFNFGYKLLITEILATTYQNIYNLIIGRSYSASTLGYYSKSSGLKDMVSTSILGTVSKVSYPLLSNFQGDKERLSSGFKKIIRHVSYLSFPVFFGMIAVSDPMIRLLFGDKWIPMIPYFRVLCLSAIVFPHNALNLSVLKVFGRSDLFLKLDVIYMAIGLTVITLTMILNLGINGLLGAILLLSIVGFIVYTRYAEEFIDYSLLRQLKDLSPSLVISVIMSLVVYGASVIVPFSNSINLAVLIILGVSTYVSLSWILRLNEFISIREILIGFVRDRFSIKN